jgi:predicted nucleotidyltransferase
MAKYIEILDIVEKYNISLLVTFGSFNTERFTEESDIDVAYISKTSLDSEQEMQLLCDLILYFQRDKIDLVNLSKAVPLLMYEIACNSQVLYEEDDSYLRFKMKASARYADTKFLRDMRREYLNSIIGNQ